MTGTSSTPREDRSANRAAPVPLIAGAVLFLVVIVYLVTASFLRKAMPMFEPTVGTSIQHGDSLVTDTITVDASDVDEWRFFDFALGTKLEVPDTSGWDLAFRRFHVMPAAPVANLGPRDFADVGAAPTSGYVETEFAHDTVNAAVDRWYHYNIITHQLEPTDNIYAMKTSDGGTAKFEFLSYYCVGVKPGCITLRYVYQRQPGQSLN